MMPRWAPALLVCLTACGQRATMPEPETVVDAYATAIETGNTAALHDLMSQESKRAVSQEDLARVLAEQRDELVEHAKELQSAERLVTARADVRYDDGEIVSLELAQEGFRVSAADALPASARSPEQALGQLRKVLARRSYAGLLRVLSPRTRAAIERDLRSLVEGLSEPEALRLDVAGDSATVEVPGGHLVKLRREDGVWYVDDFD